MANDSAFVVLLDVFMVRISPNAATNAFAIPSGTGVASLPDLRSYSTASTISIIADKRHPIVML